MTQEPHPALDTMPVHIGLARLAAALTAWDTGSSPAMAAAGAVGGAGTGTSPAQGSRERRGTGRHQQDPPGRTLT